MKKKWKKSYLTEGSIHKETCPLFCPFHKYHMMAFSIFRFIVDKISKLSLKKKVFVSRPKSNWLPFLRPHSSISNLGDILFIVNKSVKSLMCDIEVKSKKCKELTLYRCYYCCAHSHCSKRSQRSKPIDSRPEGKPQEPLLVFFSRDNRPLNGIKLLTAPKEARFF